MHIDDNVLNSESGHIIFIHGSMFSGKTDELVSILNRAQQYAGLNVQAFKYSKDKRYSDDKIYAHNGMWFPATPVTDANEMYSLLNKDVKVIGIDEPQFMDEEVIKFCLTQRDNGSAVIVSTLLADAYGEQFLFRGSKKSTSDLLLHSDYAIHKTAFCKCGKTALYSKLKQSENNTGEQVKIGGKDLYEAQCPKCYSVVQDIIHKD